MKKIFAILSISLLIVCGISPINSYAEGFEFPAGYTGTTVTGTIVDCTKPKDTIPGASIKNSTASKYPAVSNDYGMFEYTFTMQKIGEVCKAADETPIQLTITSMGYKNKTIDVSKCNEITKKTIIKLGTITLQPDAMLLDECTAVADREGLNCSPTILNQLKAKSGTYSKTDNTTSITYEKYFCDITCGDKMKKIAAAEENKNIEEFSEEIYECACLDPNPAQDGITKYEYNENSKSCFISKCDTPKYELEKNNTDQSQNKCNAIECKIENGTGKWTGGVNNWECTVDECDANFIEDPRATTTDKMCVSTDCTSEIATTAENKEQIERAEKIRKGDILVCQVKKCKDGFKPNANKDGCAQKKKCTPEQAKEHPNASDTEFKNGQCIATECFCGYNLINGKCDPWANNEACDNKNDPKLPTNAKSGTKACTHQEIQNVATTPASQRKKKKAYCDITECNDNYRQEKENTPDNKCVSTKGDNCLSEIKDPRAEKAEYKIDKKTNQRTCVITKCKEETKTENGKKKKLIYVPNEAGTACVQSKGECSLDQNEHPGGLEGKIKKGKCVPSKCKKGYELKKDKCIELNILSKEDSEKQIAELKDNAEALKKNEQSKENRMLSGAAIGATGIGGMQLASALAEQNADEDAEEAMRAYLATFHCNYAPGKNIAGGAKDVELPGGNELIDLLGEYVNLANDLKLRKTALDMKPGIESEPILDTAITGLYDDISVGKISGAYASLARALLNPEGEDAKRWAKQKSDTKTKLITGASIAGVGAVGGLVGDLLINKDSPKNTMKDILARYESQKKPSSQLLKDLLETATKELPVQEAKCPNDAKTEGERCICNDQNKIYDNNECKGCPKGSNATATQDTCSCTNGSFNPKDWKCETSCKNDEIWSEQENKCRACPENSEAVATANTCVCKITGQTFGGDNDWTCKCSGEKIEINGKCECPNGQQEDNDGNCVDNTQTEANNTTAVIPAMKLFPKNKYELDDDAKKLIKNWAAKIKSRSASEKCTIEVHGYTDPVGGEDFNIPLSTERAKAVTEALNEIEDKDFTISKTLGHGAENCNCDIVNTFTEKDKNTLLEALNLDNTNQHTMINYEADDYSGCKDHQGDDHPLAKDSGKTFAPCRRVEIKIGEHCILNENNNTTN